VPSLPSYPTPRYDPHRLSRFADEKTTLQATLADVRGSLAALRTEHAELSARLDATVATLEKEEAAHHAEAERALALEEDVAALQAVQADLESKVR